MTPYRQLQKAADFLEDDIMFEMERTVFCSHLGEGGELRNSMLVDYLQDTSSRHLETHPVLAEFFEKEDCVMFLISRQIDILRRPVYGEKLRIMTRTYELNRMYGFRNTVICGEDGSVCVYSSAGGAFMNTQTLKPMRVPAELIERVQIYERMEQMEYLPRKIALPDRQPDLVSQVMIRKCDIDMNEHVNNARYLDIADEYVENCSSVKRLRIEYKQPVKKDDTITAAVYHDENSSVIALENGSGKQCCILEYSF